jgi:hypothetical protein
MKERWRCPYRFCQENVLLVGPKKSAIRKHKYEGGVDCPGSDFDIRSPAQEQHRLMNEREEAMFREAEK